MNRSRVMSSLAITMDRKTQVETGEQVAAGRSAEL
jgi:hypothetical protein